MREMPLRRKATSRSTAPLSLATRLGLLSSRRQEIIRPAFEHPRGFYSAKKVILLGGDLAANLVKFLEHHLIMLGLPVSCATSPAEVVHKVRMTGKRDLVIAVSYGRGLRQTVEGLRQAQANGAYCVGITNTLISPLNQFANECFLTSVDTPSFGASYVAPMAFLNVIIAACANYRRSRTLTLLKLVEDEQKHGFRWYESS